MPRRRPPDDPQTPGDQGRATDVVRQAQPDPLAGMEVDPRHLAERRRLAEALARLLQSAYLRKLAEEAERDAERQSPAGVKTEACEPGAQP